MDIDGRTVRTRVPNARLRALLDEADLTQDILARAVNAAGAEIGLVLRYDRTSVAHWLAGSQPVKRAVPLVCEVLGRRTRRVVTAQDAGFAPAPAALPPHRTGRPDRRLRELVGGLSVFLPYRPTASLPVPAARSELREHLVRAVAESPAGLLGEVESLFTHTLLEHGGGFARETLRAYLAEAGAERLRTARGHERRQLCAHASRLTLLLGRMYADDSHHGAAQWCYREAWHLGNEAQYAEPAVIALRTLSAQALRLGHRRVASASARSAVRAARTASPAVRGFAQAQWALVAAGEGDRDEALSALKRAERAVEVGGQDTSRPFEHYGWADFEYQRAETLLALRDPAAAVRAFERALSARADRDRRGAALTRLRLAEVLLTQGRADEAHEHGLVVGEESGGLRTVALAESYTALRRALLHRGR